MADDIARSIMARYIARTEGSGSQNADAKKVLPGGDTRTSTYYGPYPAYMEKGEGFTLTDTDGNRYIDFLNNYTVLVHGHTHPAVMEAIHKQLAFGTALGSACASQIELATMICERVPSIELIRFTNSGTEATMMAMRAARAFTGRDIILKMDGGYHGTHDWAEVNSVADTSQGVPAVTASTGGIPKGLLQAMMVARFNDLDMVEQMLRNHHQEIAAVIVEPVQGSAGGIRAEPGYLYGLRQLTEKYGVILIFDEMITFRLNLGGYQRLEGIKPDLTCLGKVIGGGFAIGAFGGRRDIMEQFNPTNPRLLIHAGTFNGHNITMAAGIATLKHFGQAEIDRIGELGARLRAGFERAFASVGIKGQAAGLGSLTVLHWTDGVVADARDAALCVAAARDVPRLLHIEMMNHGIFAAPRGQYTTSTPMTETEIDRAVEAFEDSLRVLKPHMAEHTPHLVAD